MAGRNETLCQSQINYIPHSMNSATGHQEKDQRATYQLSKSMFFIVKRFFFQNNVVHSR